MISIATSALTFFLSPLGRWVGVGLLIASAYAYGYYKGDQHGDKQCADARLRMTIARQKVELAIEREQRESATKTAAELEQQRDEAQEKLSELQKRLQIDPGSVYDEQCRVVDPAAKRVRDKSGPR